VVRREEWCVERSDEERGVVRREERVRREEWCEERSGE
jgi:hypothetical protein